jgi:steroid delta-isomerase-like uncharacterized protein
MPTAEALIKAYYAAFNKADPAAMLALLTDDVVHDINQGTREIGRAAFEIFLGHMNRSYRERLVDIVVMTEPTGTRAAAEFVVQGTYLQSDAGLPAAQGQTYVLPAGAFFELRAGLICRVSNTYNLADWIAQVSISR